MIATYSTPHPVRSYQRVAGEGRYGRCQPRSSGQADRHHRASASSRRSSVMGLAVAAIVAFGVTAGPALVSSLGSTPVVAAAPSGPVRSVIAQPGDTLWGIAREYRGDTPIEDYVNLLIEVNHGPAIQAGQRILVP